MGEPAFPRLRRLTVDEALRMVQAGVLGEHEPVELLDGWLVEMSPQGPLHASSTTNLADRLRETYTDDGHVREEKPLACGIHSLPEPDVAVVKGIPADYVTQHPSGSDAILVVELAWSSLDEDRSKAKIYAASGVPVYWLVDLVARTVTVHTSPSSGGYRDVAPLHEGTMVPLPGRSMAWPVKELLGPAATNR
ncbi:MAG: Uma2 family endonuclease [Myxococcota bacterium]